VERLPCVTLIFGPTKLLTSFTCHFAYGISKAHSLLRRLMRYT